MKPALLNNLLLLVWVSLMASSFVMSADLIPYANAITSTALRFMLASVMMIPLLMVNYPASKKRFKATKIIYFQYSIISAFLVLFFVGLFEALKTTSALRTSVIYTLVPLLSIFITYVALQSKTSKMKLLGFMLGTVGAVSVLLGFNQQSSGLFVFYIGDGIFVLACVCLSIHVVLVKQWGSRVPPIQGSFYIMVLGGAMLVPFMLMLGELESVAWHVTEFWSLLLYLTVFTTMMTFFLQQYLVQKVGPNRLLAFTYLIPILVVIPQGWPALLQLKESASGILITLLALYLISKEPKAVT